jgi:NSS family neurotransmitter:Na+ symporter
MFPGLAGATVFELLDRLTSNLLLPVAGFALSVLAGWVLPARLYTEELRLTARGAARLRWTLRYAAPAAIAVAALAPFWSPA